MKGLTRRHFVAASAAGLAGATTLAVAAGTTLARPARLILGFPPGGSNDYLARQIATQLSGRYAPNVIVENKAGAQGRIAASMVKTADPDGTVLLQTTSSSMTLFQHLYKDMPYDALADFEPVTALANFDYILVVREDLGVRSLGEFIDWCKANPKNAVYATPAQGSAPHLLGLTLARSAGFQWLHVPYKGAAPSLQALLAGEIVAYIGLYSDIVAQLPAGKLRVLASSGPDRSRFMPSIPTFAEAGFDKVRSRQWFGIFAPARTPAPIVQQLNQIITSALDSPLMQDSLTRQGMDGAGSSTAAFARRIRDESTEWKSIVASAGFVME